MKLRLLAAVVLIAGAVLHHRVSAQEVVPADLSALSPSEFSDEELDLPFYLAHLHRIANSIDLEGPERGFIDIAVWREPDGQSPDNIRVMENVLSLAYFYTTERPWNPYYGDPALRARIEAALQFWVDSQQEEGIFGKASEPHWSLTFTAFGSKFMAETLRLLRSGPPVSNDLLLKVTNALRRAVTAVLTRADYHEVGLQFANKMTSVWGGALGLLEEDAGAEILGILESAIPGAYDELQSPAGYFYENRGPDWTYDLETHHSNHVIAWHYLQHTALRERYLAMLARWYEWLAYNAVPEPDGSGFTMNYAFQSRLTFPFYRNNRVNMFGQTCPVFAEQISIARAFCESVPERAARLERTRAALRASWPSVPPLEVGTFSAYSPYAFLHRDHGEWYPTRSQKNAATNRLPARSTRHFTHLRVDDRYNFGVLFINREHYYASFAKGVRQNRREFFGLTLLSNHSVGALMQSHPRPELAWGTRRPDQELVYEHAIPDAALTVDGSRVGWNPGARDLPQGGVRIAYELGRIGSKVVAFTEEEIRVSIRHPGSFVETIPLLVHPSWDVRVTGEGVAIDTAEGEYILEFDRGTRVEISSGNRRTGNKRVMVVSAHARDGLEYSFRPGQ